MADIFNNMFFCNGSAAIEPPQSASQDPPRRKSMGGQDLSEYLKAYRSKGDVDEEWKRAHQKGRGKKRFKKLVNKQIMIARMQNLGAQKRRQSTTVSQRFKPRGSIHESFLFTDQEHRRLAEIAKANEEKRKKREEYLRQNKSGNDRESLSSGHSRRRKKWKSKKNKQDPNDDASSDFSVDLDASMRSLDLAFKLRSTIDEKAEDSEEGDEKKNNDVVQDDNTPDQVAAKDDEEEDEDENEDEDEDEDGQAENLPNEDENSISSIEDLLAPNVGENNDDDDDEQNDSEKEENDGENEDDEEEKEEKKEEGNQGSRQNLIPTPSNLPFFLGKRRSSDKSTTSEGKTASTPSKIGHRSPRSTRRVAPELTVTPLRTRSVSRDRSPSVPKSKFLTPKASPSHFPASPNKAPQKETALRKKPLTQPKDPFTSRRERKARVDQVKPNPRSNAVRRTGAGAAQSKLFDRSPSRSRLGADGSQKSIAKRPLKKANIKGKGGSKDKNEGGVPMQNYGTLKF